MKPILITIAFAAIGYAMFRWPWIAFTLATISLVGLWALTIYVFNPNNGNHDDSLDSHR
jgi:hypothetical protein